MVTASQIGERLADMVRSAEDATDEIRRASRAVAEADMTYREMWSKAYAASAGEERNGRPLPVEERKSMADLATLTQRHALKLSEGEYAAAMEASRTKRAAVSAFQTWAGAWKAEMEFTRTSPPGVVP